MVILIAAVGLGLLGVILAMLLRGRRETARTEMTNRRVEAYILTIRREGTNPTLAAMSDDELRDLLLSGAHNLRQQNDRKWFLLLGGLIVASAAAIGVGTIDGMRGFGIAAVVSAMVLYGLNEYMTRRIREPLASMGIDIERLRVE